MSGSSTPNNSPSQSQTQYSANSVASLAGIQTTTPNFLVFEAGQGLYISIGGSPPGNGNTPEAIDSGKGNFFISAQNGEIIIRSRDDGSIHLYSTKGNLIVDVPNGNVESNVGQNTTNNNSGNVTNNTTGNYLNNTTGNQTSYTYGNQYSWARGVQTQIVQDVSNSIYEGGLNQVVIGECVQIALGEQNNINVGGLQNVVLGDILDFFVGMHNTVTLGFQTEWYPGHTSETELEMKAVTAKLDDHQVWLAQTNLHIAQQELCMMANNMTIIT